MFTVEIGDNLAFILMACVIAYAATRLVGK